MNAVRLCVMLLVTSCILLASCSSGPSKSEVVQAVIKYWETKERWEVDSVAVIKIGDVSEEFGRQCVVRVYMEYRPYSFIYDRLQGRTTGQFDFHLVDNGLGEWELIR